MPRSRFLFNLFLSLAWLSTPSVALAGSESAGVRQTLAPERTFVGTVVDPQGAAVIRARVRLIDAAGVELAAALTDERGRFRIDAPACSDCRIEASLTGFTPATAVAAAGETQLVLGLAPVRASVVVSATRDLAPSSQVGSTVTVFSAEDIDRRGLPLVADVLRATPGVTVVRSGGLGNQTSLFVRGGDSTYNKVLLDGIPINEPGGTFNFGSLTTDNLDRIEIVRGAQSALFGSDAMSSVIQLVTRRADRLSTRARVSANLETGSYDTHRVGAGLAGRVGAWDYVVEGSRLDTDNRTPNNDLGSSTLSWSAGGRLTAGLSLRAIGRLERQRVGTPGATAFGRPDLDAFFRRRDVTAGAALEHDAGRFSQRVSYAVTTSDQTSTNLVADPPYTPSFKDRSAPFTFDDFLYDSHNVLRRHSLSYQGDWHIGRSAKLGEHFLTVALDYDGERATLENRMAATTVPASRNNVGWTLQHQVVGRRLSLATGMRVERNASFGVAIVPRVSAAYVVRRASSFAGDTILKANAGLGVKEPTILQSFSPAASFLGNPDLEPERSRALDLGLEQRLFRDRAKVDAIWFDNRYRNQISTRTLGFSPFRAQYFNIGLTDARGVELAAEVAPALAIRARGGYTWLASRIVESTAPLNPVFASGQWAFRRPRHSGFLDVSWQVRRVGVDLWGLFTGRRVDSDFSVLVPPIEANAAYALWTVGARYRVRPGQIDWWLRLENLTDVEYMEPLGFPAWRRTVHTGVRVTF